jgi:hypothetical protein
MGVGMIRVSLCPCRKLCRTVAYGKWSTHRRHAASEPQCDARKESKVFSEISLILVVRWLIPGALKSRNASMLLTRERTTAHQPAHLWNAWGAPVVAIPARSLKVDVRLVQLACHAVVIYNWYTSTAGRHNTLHDVKPSCCSAAHAQVL